MCFRVRCGHGRTPTGAREHIFGVFFHNFLSSQLDSLRTLPVYETAIVAGVVVHVVVVVDVIRRDMFACRESFCRPYRSSVFRPRRHSLTAGLNCGIYTFTRAREADLEVAYYRGEGVSHSSVHVSSCWQNKQYVTYRILGRCRQLFDCYERRCPMVGPEVALLKILRNLAKGTELTLFCSLSTA